MTDAQINIRMPSVQSLLLRLTYEDRSLATATGFVVEHDGAPYLLTNWHVVTGRHPSTGQPLDEETKAVPDALVIMQNVADQLGRWVPETRPLYDEDGQPLWLEHPVHGRSVDVVALPLDRDEQLIFYPYDVGVPERVILNSPSHDASIIGFPFGVTGGGCLAIWVSGTIASEPDVDFDELPCFLIDSRTRRGQSGSPVLLYRVGSYLTEAGGISLGGGEIINLIGVYSGRINPESDLGRVWKVKAVRDILAAERRGPIPRVGTAT